MLTNKGYSFTNYVDYSCVEKPVILRHDIDFSLKKALTFAELEHAKNVKSTYFILLSTNFYNIFSKESTDILKRIEALGHDIGLHFDEKKYTVNNEKELEQKAKKEALCLDEIFKKPINVVSMHRPSAWILNNDIRFDGLINSYCKTFIGEFKYLSDSRMHWRENVIDNIESGCYNKLHILTHPFWYSENTETIKEKLLSFISNAKTERYYEIKNNFKNLEEVIDEAEIEWI